LLGVYTIIRTSDFGWFSVHTVVFGAATIGSLMTFVVREARTANPLVPIRIFRSRNASGANVVVLLIFAAMFGMFFLGSLYFQRVLGYDPLGLADERAARRLGRPAGSSDERLPTVIRHRCRARAGRPPRGGHGPAAGRRSGGRDAARARPVARRCGWRRDRRRPRRTGSRGTPPS